MFKVNDARITVYQHMYYPGTDSHPVKISSDESIIANSPTSVPIHQAKASSCCKHYCSTTVGVSEIPDKLGKNFK